MRVEPRGSDQRGVQGTSHGSTGPTASCSPACGSCLASTPASLAQVCPTAEIPFRSDITLPVALDQVPTLMVYPGYFSTLGLPLIAGRDFQDSDLSDRTTRHGGDQRGLWPAWRSRGRIPIGARLTTPQHGGDVSREIIGVVAASPYADLRGERSAGDLPAVPADQHRAGTDGAARAQRWTGRGAGRRASARRSSASTETCRCSPPRTLAEEMDAVLVRERLLATLSGFFGGLALLLASVGLYGLFAFSVVRRTSGDRHPHGAGGDGAGGGVDDPAPGAGAGRAGGRRRTAGGPGRRAAGQPPACRPAVRARRDRPPDPGGRQRAAGRRRPAGRLPARPPRLRASPMVALRAD